MKRITLLLCAICFLALTAGLVHAQEDVDYDYTEYDDEGYEEQVVEEEDYVSTEYAFGTVISVDSKTNEIIISEYDWRNESDIDVAFTIDSATDIEGFTSWNSIPTGAYVDIEYMKDKTGKKIAKSISISEETE